MLSNRTVKLQYDASGMATIGMTSDTKPAITSDTKAEITSNITPDLMLDITQEAVSPVALCPETRIVINSPPSLAQEAKEAKEPQETILSIRNIQRCICYLGDRYSGIQMAWCALGTTILSIPTGVGSYYMLKEGLENTNPLGVAGYTIGGFLFAVPALIGGCIFPSVVACIAATWRNEEGIEDTLVAVSQELCIPESTSSTKALLEEFQRIFPEQGNLTERSFRKNIEKRKAEIFCFGVFDKKSKETSSLLGLRRHYLFDRWTLPLITSYNEEEQKEAILAPPNSITPSDEDQEAILATPNSITPSDEDEDNEELNSPSSGNLEAPNRFRM